MSLFVIADTHLSLSCEKPMDVFGARWKDYTQRLEAEWRAVVKEEDTVVIAGDISWGMTVEEAKADFDFIEALPGQKIIMKGNHDYWWQTMAKLDAFVEQNGYKTIRFLHNNAYACEDFIICGSRGWYNDDKNKPLRGADSEKIVAREVTRIGISLDAGHNLRRKLLEEDGKDREVLAFLHFPPIFKGYMCDEIIMELYRKGVERCFFGHIHGCYDAPLKREYADIDFYFIAADYLAFRPFKIEPKNV
ncbi:MAG: serine/threonine protein phosphatase [Ruminococcaceae bacterium]|nr:serine/threonine protein phosphatase [Oscillospiraceae bacterium]MBO5006685.1 metallophosphoesterase [Clostridia bacterium]